MVAGEPALFEVWDFLALERVVQFAVIAGVVLVFLVVIEVVRVEVPERRGEGPAVLVERQRLECVFDTFARVRACLAWWLLLLSYESLGLRRGI